MANQMNVFSRNNQKFVPLAERCRPKKLEEIVGQEKILAEDSLLRSMLRSEKLSSFILWGPPGSGKTTIARLAAESSNYNFVSFSAVFTGIKEVKAVMKDAEDNLLFSQKPTAIFIDEIHRFNKAQQDAFLPYLEKGSITLIGATTENPSFEVIAALLSRCHVFVLEHLEDKDVKTILHRALASFNPDKIELNDEIMEYLVAHSSGDARKALNNLEAILIHHNKDIPVTIESSEKILASKAMYYDKNREEHYNIISALHKSLRGSDAQAGLYWLARMLEAGENPLYIVRRLVRFASEDIGLADPNALVQAIAVKEAVSFIGMPEANNAIAQLVIYLATAPKSNNVYTAYAAAAEDARKTDNLSVPLKIRNAPTSLMKELDYGKEYKYDHDYTNNYFYQKYFPDAMIEKVYFQPSDFGFEKEIKKRIAWWNKLKDQQIDRGEKK